MEQTGHEWVEGLHQRIATAIKSARGSRSAQWLAEQTERLGFPVSRAAIANYETGRKKRLDVAELLVLAAALRIPPITLLFRHLPDGPVEALPGIHTSSWDAAAWFSGEERAPHRDDGGWPASKEVELIRAVRERRRQLLATAQFIDYFQQTMRGTADEQRDPNSDPEIAALSEQIHVLGREVTRLEEVIRQNGGVIGGK
jgi:transcriptional regulator with XRE-family HTH domain